MKAPDCFSSLVVSDKSMACRTCPHRASCVDEAFSFLDKWNGHSIPVIDAERRRIALIAKTFKAEPALSGAKPKPEHKRKNAAVSRAASRRDMDGRFALAERELIAGRNPGVKSWEVVFFEMLLAGSFSRKALVRAYKEDERTKYTEGTARTRACTAIALFQEALLCRVDGSTISLHPRLTPDYQAAQAPQI